MLISMACKITFSSLAKVSAVVMCLNLPLTAQIKKVNFNWSLTLKRLCTIVTCTWLGVMPSPKGKDSIQCAGFLCVASRSWNEHHWNPHALARQPSFWRQQSRLNGTLPTKSKILLTSEDQESWALRQSCHQPANTTNWEKAMKLNCLASMFTLFPCAEKP